MMALRPECLSMPHVRSVLRKLSVAIEAEAKDSSSYTLQSLIDFELIAAASIPECGETVE